MTPLPGLRRHSWLSGATLLALAVVLAAGVGLAVGSRSWGIYLGLIAIFVLCMGAVERLWARRSVPPPPRARGKLKVIRGGKTDYDLAEDDSTDSQRYLM